jgi:hypothetical protein
MAITNTVLGKNRFFKPVGAINAPLMFTAPRPVKGVVLQVKRYADG